MKHLILTVFCCLIANIALAKDEMVTSCQTNIYGREDCVEHAVGEKPEFPNCLYQKCNMPKVPGSAEIRVAREKKLQEQLQEQRDYRSFIMEHCVVREEEYCPMIRNTVEWIDCMEKYIKKYGDCSNDKSWNKDYSCWLPRHEECELAAKEYHKYKKIPRRNMRQDSKCYGRMLDGNPLLFRYDSSSKADKERCGRLSGRIK